jgi:uncharacterized protein (DUF2345 family)
MSTSRSAAPATRIRPGKKISSAVGIAARSAQNKQVISTSSIASSSSANAGVSGSRPFRELAAEDVALLG